MIANGMRTISLKLRCDYDKMQLQRCSFSRFGKFPDMYTRERKDK